MNPRKHRTALEEAARKRLVWKSVFAAALLLIAMLFFC